MNLKIIFRFTSQYNILLYIKKVCYNERLFKIGCRTEMKSDKYLKIVGKSSIIKSLVTSRWETFEG